MYIIGLSGNFGTGKTTVAEMLARHGAVVINADSVGHRLLQKGSEAYGELIDIFGRDILLPDGQIDRRRLGKCAFENRQNTAKLNAVMRPRIRQELERLLEQQRMAGTEVLVLEAALLVRDDWKGVIDEIWVTSADQSLVVERLKKGRGYDEDEVISRLQQQLSPDQLLAQADVVLHTGCTLPELKQRVDEEWRRLKKRMR